MAYFLGCKDSEQVNPLSLDSKDILDIIYLTTSFNNEEELVSYLSGKGLIESRKKFAYFISKGTMDRKTRKYDQYNQLDYPKIYYKEDKNAFTINGIIDFISKNRNDDQFMNLLYSRYILKKVGSTCIKRRLMNIVNNDEYTIELFNTLFNSTSSDSLKGLLRNFGKYYTNNRNNKDREFYSNYNAFINDLWECVSCNDEDLVNLYELLNKKTEVSKIPVINLLSTFYNNRNDSNMMNFINEVIYDYDKEKKQFKMKNDKLKIKRRDLCDLSAIIVEYNDYLKHLKNLLTKEEEIEDDDKDEFLDENEYIIAYGNDTKQYQEFIKKHKKNDE